jgi:hypothetical protein
MIHRHADNLDVRMVDGALSRSANGAMLKEVICWPCLQINEAGASDRKALVNKG